MITKTGKQKLEEKLAKLRQELKEVGGKRGKAAAEGDLKENSAYIFLTEKANFIYCQIEELVMDLKKVVVQKKPDHNDFICFGHQVEIIYEKEKRRKTLLLVGKNEAQFFPNGVSCETPIAQALMGKKVGETVLINNQPVKILKIKIIEV